MKKYLETLKILVGAKEELSTVEVAQKLGVGVDKKGKLKVYIASKRLQLLYQGGKVSRTTKPGRGRGGKNHYWSINCWGVKLLWKHGQIEREEYERLWPPKEAAQPL